METKREKTTNISSMHSQNYYFLGYLSFAQSTSLLSGGKYSDKIIRPGIPNIHPWKMGIRPPIIPTITNNIPSVILSESFSNYRLTISGLDKMERKSSWGLFIRWESKKLFINRLINDMEILEGKFPTSTTYLIIGEYRGMSV